MNIVSYRGPGIAGGVSSALSRLWQESASGDMKWWHVAGTTLSVAEHKEESPREITNIATEIIEGHYRYCNEFLWPVMHGLPHFARYRAQDHKLYAVANRIIARAIAIAPSARTDRNFFVQDYQLALQPDLLSRASVDALIFWHIPWPEFVESQHIPQLVQIARGLISAEVIAFHTEEYVQNFLHFVHQHLHGVFVDFDQSTLRRGIRTGFALEAGAIGLTDGAGKSTVVVAAPLGIDLPFWKRAASIPQLRLHSPDFWWLRNSLPYVLSVDRADYTKGVLERLHAIDKFFQMQPQWRGKVNFVQICARSRMGVEAFDSYWNQCKVEAAKLESKWRTDHWSPVVWTEYPCSSEELAVIYRDAALMLVNPLRDGLNLTAKEFVASQVRTPGMLALSDNAGVWHELGDEAIRLQPSNAEQMALAINHGLTMRSQECARRITLMKLKLADNSLNDWWRQIAAHVAVTARGPHCNSMLANLRSVHF